MATRNPGEISQPELLALVGQMHVNTHTLTLIIAEQQAHIAELEAQVAAVTPHVVSDETAAV